MQALIGVMRDSGFHIYLPNSQGQPRRLTKALEDSSEADKLAREVSPTIGHAALVITSGGLGFPWVHEVTEYFDLGDSMC
jgi:hypothetical protein